MDIYTIVAVVVFGIYFVSRVFINRNTPHAARISPADARQKLAAEQDAILLDVRTHSEYARRHIPRSRLIPVSDLAAAAPGQLPDRDAPIIVYCASGSRSSAAARTLIRLGYTQVYDMGGISRWPYETVSGSK